MNHLSIFFFFIITSLLFFFGGLFQFLGFLSLTQTNIVVLFFMSLTLLMYKEFSHLLIRFSLFVSLFLFLVMFLSGSDFVEFIVYLYYFLSFLVVFLYARFLRFSKIGDVFFNRKFLSAFLLFNFIVLLFQKYSYGIISSLSAIDIEEIDITTGTFYLKSDASLSFFCIGLVFFLMVKKKLSSKFGLLTSIMSFCIVFSANSKAAQLILLLLIASSFLFHFQMFHKKYFALTLVPLVVFFLNYTDFLYHADSFLFDDYVENDGREIGSRVSPLAIWMYTKQPFFGLGFLSYYNPLSDSWYIYGGFSTIYSILFDIGYPLLVLIYLCFGFLVHISCRNILEAFLAFFIFVSFSMSNFVFTDVAFVLSFFYFLNYAKSKDEVLS